MKKGLFVITFLLFLASALSAQTRHGVVHYAVDYRDTDLSAEEISMLPSEASILFKDDLMRMNMSMGLGMESAVVVQKDQVHVLMDVMGNKFALRTTREEILQDTDGNKPFALKQMTDEFKDIAGYRCRRAVLSAPGQEDMTVWFTDRLKSSATWYYQLDGIDGFPMEFDLTTTGMAVRMTAKSVSEELPGEAEFTVGKEFKILTEEELNKMMGAGR